MSITGKIGNSIGTIFARGTGLATVGMVAYDAHVMGKLEADTFSQSNESARLVDGAKNRMYMDTPSTVVGKIKDKIFDLQLRTSILMPFEAVLGYFKGVGNTCIEGIVPLGLGLGALLGGKKVSGMSALGIFMYAGYKFITEGFGFTRPDRLNSSFK